MALLAIGHGGPVRATGSAEDASCQRHDLGLQLVPNESSWHHVAGWLCATELYDGQTVVVASPTGLATHAYWDWPEDKDAYSFVRAFTQAGFAVFNYDRIGTGLSERPPAALVSLPTEAFVLHQIVSALQVGSHEDVSFGKVVLAGNSLSTLIQIFEAELYQDVDGLINTGIVIGPSPVGLAKLFAAFYPAQLDPKFAGNPDIPLGYATTQPGSRDQFFYLPSSEPATVQLDEELKDTATVGEAATFGAWIPFTQLVNVPVLSVVGDHDILACLTVCEPDGIEFTKEQLFWSPATCFQMEILAGTGHFVQLQRNSAAGFTALAQSWLARRIGNGATHLPTEPCTG